MLDLNSSFLWIFFLVWLLYLVLNRIFFKPVHADHQRAGGEGRRRFRPPGKHAGRDRDPDAGRGRPVEPGPQAGPADQGRMARERRADPQPDRGPGQGKRGADHGRQAWPSWKARSPRPNRSWRSRSPPSATRSGKRIYEKKGPCLFSWRWRWPRDWPLPSGEAGHIDWFSLLAKVFNSTVLFGGLILLLRKPLIQMLSQKSPAVRNDIEEREKILAATEIRLQDVRRRLAEVAAEVDGIKNGAETAGRAELARLEEAGRLEAERIVSPERSGDPPAGRRRRARGQGPHRRPGHRALPGRFQEGPRRRHPAEDHRAQHRRLRRTG